MLYIVTITTTKYNPAQTDTRTKIQLTNTVKQQETEDKKYNQCDKHLPLNTKFQFF